MNGGGSNGETRTRIWPGLVAILGLAAVLRFRHLWVGLPQLPAADDPTVMDRAIGLLHGHLPTEYDWPSGAMMLLAGTLRVGSTVWGGLAHDLRHQYVLARTLFAAVGVALVGLVALLGREIAPRRQKQWVAWGSGLLVAVAYTAVRMSRQLHPEVLETTFVTGALLCTVRFDRDRRTHWLVAAAACAGAAAGSKYLGAVSILVLVASIWLDGQAPLARRAGRTGLAAAAGAAGFVSCVPAILVHPNAVLTGMKAQLTHQSTGHLGFDTSHHAWWFHAARVMPGSWGMVATIAAAVGVIGAAVAGTRAQRLVAGYVALAFFVVGASKVEFAHYSLIFVPEAAPLAALAVVEAGRRLRLQPALATGFLALTLIPTAVNDARLVRASGVGDTRLIAAQVLDGLHDAPIVEDRHSDRVGGARTAEFSIAYHPNLLTCRCYVVLSSYMEDEFRREPVRYASEVAVYDQVRAAGTTVRVIRPSLPLSYRWDSLPEYGEGRIPLTGSLDLVGPIITVLDLRTPK